MKKIAILTILLLTTTSVFAHGLVGKTKVEIIEIQKELVSKKFLTNSQFKYGEINAETESAYDLFLAYQMKERILKEREEQQKQATTTSAVESEQEKIEEPTFFGYIISLFKQWFK